MKSRKLIELATAIFITMTSTAYCQKIARIEDLGSRVEKMWEVAIPIQPNKNHPSGIIYALLKSGVAVLSPDGKTIYCYDYNNGRLKWQAQGIQINSSNGGLYSTADGEYCLLGYPDETAYTHAIYNANGQLLWQASNESPFVISPSGNYLFSTYLPVDGDLSLEVLELKTGKKLWRADLPERYFYWQAATGLNDKIAYYNGGALKLFQLEDGRMLWEKTVNFDGRADVGAVHLSRTGNVVAYDCFLTTDDYGRLSSNQQIVTYVFDEDGNMLWNRTKKVISGRADGGRIKGISGGGEYIAVNTAAGLSVYDIKTQKELWTVLESGLHSLKVFTKNILTFSPRIPESTKLIILKADGSISGNYTLDQLVDFRYENGTNLFSSKGDITGGNAVVVTKSHGEFILSKFAMRSGANK
jgi:outer membrane protein assembly factor BamB